MRYRVRASNTTIAIEDGVVAPLDGDCDFELAIPDGEIHPGLINAHDHLHRNHYGRLGHPPYANAYDWGRDIHRSDAEAIAAGQAVDRRSALLEGARKNLLAGVTTVVHHDRWEDDFSSGFPLRVVRVRHAHSLGFERDPAAFSGGDGVFAIHLAEGIDDASAEEVRELERRGLLNESLLAVHVVGADDDGVRRIRESGAAIVWCPTSNQFLFGRTVPRALLASGVDVLLGSDSRLTGAGSLLDELRAARSLGFLSDLQLLRAVGETTARRLGIPYSSLGVGERADFVVFKRPLLEATERDVALVVVDGIPRVMEPMLAETVGGAFGVGCDVWTHGVRRVMVGAHDAAASKLHA